MPIFLLIAALALCIGFGWAQATVFRSQPQAIELAFPTSRVERKTAFLTKAQVAQIETLVRVKPDSQVVTYYVARSSGRVQGVAFFDRRVVRTLPIVYMAVVKPSGTIDRVEVLSFDEPEDYLPPPRWLALYRSRRLTDDLTLGRGIPHITGASLTSQALNDGLRLILAIYQVVVKDAL